MKLEKLNILEVKSKKIITGEYAVVGKYGLFFTTSNVINDLKGGGEQLNMLRKRCNCTSTGLIFTFNTEKDCNDFIELLTLELIASKLT